jgi:type VI protein secretion system component VasK
MIAWLTTLTLRVKLYALAAVAALLFIGGLYVRYKLASAKATKQEARADALDAARSSERRIATKRLELSIKQRQIREQLAAKKQRDAFEDQGWGP